MAGYGPLVLRLTLGTIFLMHAYLGFYLMGPEGMTKFLSGVGIPLPKLATWYSILAEGLGGLCLVLGIFIRWAALANALVIAGALYFVHLKQGFFMKPEGGYEFALLVLAATVALALTGPGNFTLKK